MASDSLSLALGAVILVTERMSRRSQGGHFDRGNSA